MKTSLILTTKNEESSIAKLLDSINDQTLKPNEIVIADSLSSDKTIKIINSCKKSLPIKVISQKCNRSEGRNLAIKNAKNEIIAATDAGCILDKNWLKNITEPFRDKSIDVVSGYYMPIIKSVLDELVYLYTSIIPQKLNKEKFFPSSRSVAFRKKAWKDVNGYPEFLDSSEDMYFNLQLKKKHKKFFMQETAVVYWHPRSPNQSIFKQFYVMATSSAYGGIIKKSVYLQFFRYIIGLVLLLLGNYKFLILLFVLYCFWPMIKHKKLILLFPVFQMYIDLSVMSGTISGILKRYAIRRNLN